MDAQQACESMVMPSMARPGKPRGGVIQIWLTHVCDKCCFGCTQASNIKRPVDYMSPEQFEQAVSTLEEYFGIVGIFGGNPCLHPDFETICGILRQHIPKERCGLWANRFMGKGQICRQTFNPAVSNLNVHLDKSAYEEMRRDWPEAHPFGLVGESRHGPPFVAIKDVMDDEGEMWDLISRCDINRHWSAMIGVFRGELRAWFCEIAGSQSMLHQREADYPDTGLPVLPGWWLQPRAAFAPQVLKHCPECGVPLRGRGNLACDPNGVEQVSPTHLAVYTPKHKGRQVQVVTERSQLGNIDKFTDYLGNAKRV